MRRFVPLFAASLVSACTPASVGPEPSLAPRAAEAIDPRIPLPAQGPSGSVNSELGMALDALTSEAANAAPEFNAKLADAERLAAVAGPMASESWVAAQQALSLLIEQHGVTTRVAANIDQLGSSRIHGQRWISPADQQAIASAASQVAAINNAQATAIERLKNQLAR